MLLKARNTHFHDLEANADTDFKGLFVVVFFKLKYEITKMIDTQLHFKSIFSQHFGTAHDASIVDKYVNMWLIWKDNFNLSVEMTNCSTGNNNTLARMLEVSMCVCKHVCIYSSDYQNGM